MRPCLSWWEIEQIADGQSCDEETSAHLAACAHCARRLEQARRVRQATAALSGRVPPMPPAALKAAVAAAPRVRRLSCRAVHRMALDYADGALDEALRPAFEAHLFSCEACYRAYRELVDVRDAVSAAPSHAAPTGLRERIRAAVALRAAQPARSVWRPVWALAAAAVVLLLAVGLWISGRPEAPAGPAVAPAPMVAEAVPEVAPSHAASMPPASGPHSETASSGQRSQLAETPPAPHVSAAHPAKALRTRRARLAQARRFRARRVRVVARRRPAAVAAPPTEIAQPAAEREPERATSAVAALPPAVSETQPTVAPGLASGPVVSAGGPAPSHGLRPARPPAVAAASQPRPVTQRAEKPKPSQPAAKPKPAAPPAEPLPAGPASWPSAAVAEAPSVAPPRAKETRTEREPAKEVVRVAEAPEQPPVRWLPVRPPERTRVVVHDQTPPTDQLKALERRLNARIRADAQAAGTGWIEIK